MLSFSFHEVGVMGGGFMEEKKTEEGMKEWKVFT